MGLMLRYVGGLSRPCPQLGDAQEFLAELPASSLVEEAAVHLVAVSNLATACAALCEAGQELCRQLEGAPWGSSNVQVARAAARS